VLLCPLTYALDNLSFVSQPECCHPRLSPKPVHAMYVQTNKPHPLKSGFGGGGGGWETKAKKGWIPSCQNVGKTPLQVLMV